MSWAEPAWGFALVVVVALAALLVAAARAHHARLRGLFGDGELLRRVLPPAVRVRRRVRDALVLVGLTGIVAALAEPRFDQKLRELKAEGVDLVLAVDLSRSMDAADVDPSRLERARREILDLMDLLEGDRVGLVMFAGGAYPRMPLTLDQRALAMVVRELDTHTFQAQGSALGLAIRESLKLLKNQTGEAGKAVLVLTDGEIHDPEDALAAAREAHDAGVTVYGLVVGTEAAPIPNGDGTWLLDPTTGDRVLTAPSTDVLADVAEITGGAVVRSVPGDEDVRALYADEIRRHVKVAVGRTSRRETWDSAFQWPLGLGLAALLLAGWLGDGRRGALLLAALLALAPLSARAEDVRDGDLALREGRNADAVRIFTDLTLEHPDDPALYGWLGTARYRAGDYVGAARAFERQAALSDDANARYNAGNAYWRSGRLDRAIERYDEVLAADPEHPGAKQNRPLVEQEIQQRREMQVEQRGSESEPSKQPQGAQGEEQADQQQPANDGLETQTDPQGKQGGGQEHQQGQGAQARGDEQQGQQGEPGGQQGGRGSPDAEATPPSGQGKQGQGKQGEGEQGQEPTDGGARPDEGDAETPPLDAIGGGKPTEGAGDEAAQQGQGQGTPTTGPSGLTPEQASRVLDGVEEGAPRVYIPGERSEKPW